MRIDKEKPSTHQMPIYYLFQDKDGWHKTDARLTDDLNKSFVMRRYTMSETELHGFSFYPQFREPNKDEANLRIPAWRITGDGYTVARFRDVECEHKSWHRDCRVIANGICMRHKLIELEYLTEKKMWIQAQD